MSDDKDSITFDDIEIDLSDYGAAQASTMIDTITITGPSNQFSSSNTITLPSSAFSYGAIGGGSGGISTINNISANSQWTTGTSGYTINSGNWNSPTTVNIGTDGIDMAAGTDIKIDGKSLKEFMNKMEERLAILVPDPKKLEQFAALKKAYEHYKLMEKLCQEQPKEED
jgi:hypothetical protein